MERVEGTNAGSIFSSSTARSLFLTRRDRFFLGSEYFAREYAKGKPRYRAAVLLDMVGDVNLRLLQDRSSLEWTETAPIVKEIWSTAARLGVREFVSRPMEIGNSRRPYHVVRTRRHSLYRRGRRHGRLSPLAHRRRHAGQMFGPESGEGRLGDRGMAEKQVAAAHGSDS